MYTAARIDGRPVAATLGGPLTGDSTVHTGMVQLDGTQVRLSTVGANFPLLGTPEVVVGLRANASHCVRVVGQEGPISGYFTVTSWTRLQPGEPFTEGGLSYRCGEFGQAVQIPGVHPPPDPTAPTGGGLDPDGVPTTLPPPRDPGGGTGPTGGPSPVAPTWLNGVGLLAGLGALLFVLPERRS